MDLAGPGFCGTLLFGKLGIGRRKVVFHGEKWGALWLVFCRQALNQELLNLLSFRRFGSVGLRAPLPRVVTSLPGLVFMCDAYKCCISPQIPLWHHGWF